MRRPRSLARRAFRPSSLARPGVERLEELITPGFLGLAPLTPANVPTAMAIGDVNRDGRPDLIMASRGSDEVDVLTRNPNNSFAAPVGYAVTAPSALVATDLDRDGSLDFVTVNNPAAGNATLTAFLNDGLGNFNPAGTRTLLARGATGLAVASLDGDALPDFVVTFSNGSTVNIVRNTGNAANLFGDDASNAIRNVDAGGPQSGVVITDLNRDGRPDVAVGLLGGGVSVLRQNGFVTFDAPTPVTLTTAVSAIAAGDFNSDGKADLAAAGSDGTLTILRNDSALNGATLTLTPQTAVPLGAAPTALATEDVNRDGSLDLVATLGGETNLAVLLGNGNLTTQDVQKFAAVAGAGLAIGDLNRDGQPDVAFAGNPSGTIQLFQNTSPAQALGTFTSRQTLTNVSAPNDVVVADVDRNGRVDLVAADGRAWLTNPSLRSWRYNGLASGSFQGQGVQIDGPNDGGSVAQVDFNGDGRLDIAQAHTDPTRVGISVRLSDASGSFGTTFVFNTTRVPFAITAVDINGDGRPDLAAQSPDGLAVLLNNVAPGATIPSFSAATTLPYSVPSGGTRLTVADVNNDGRPDFLIPNGNAESGLAASTDAVALFLNTIPRGGLAPSFTQRSITTSLGSVPNAVAVGDLNFDGKPDLIVAFPGGSGGTGPAANRRIGVFLGDGTGSFSSETRFDVGNRPFGVTVADVNGDGRLDVLTANTSDSSLSLLTNATTPNATTVSFASTVTLTVSANPVAVTTGDFNRDGLMDLAVVHAGSTNTIRTFTGNRNAATNFVLTAPVTALAGVPFDLMISARTALNAQDTRYVGAVIVTLSDPRGTISGSQTYQLSNDGLLTLPTSFGTPGPQTITVRDAATGLLMGTTGVNVVPGPAASFQVVGFPSSITAGVAGSFTVTVLDALGNRVTNYTGSVDFSSNDALADLPLPYTFRIVDSGQRTFNATLRTAGTRSITVMDQASTSNSRGTQGNIDVIPAAPTRLAVSGSVADIRAGVPRQITVRATDDFGNTSPGYRGTVSFTSNDPNSVLPANTTFTDTDNGVRTFLVTLRSLGNRMVTVQDLSAGLQATYGPVTVVEGPPAFIDITGVPPTPTAGTLIMVTVTLRDFDNTVLTGYRGRIHFDSSDSQAILPDDYDYTMADAGVHTFPVTFITAGAQTLRVNDIAPDSPIGTVSITVAPAAASTFRYLNLPTTTLAGATFPYTVRAEDPFGNLATGYRGTVSFSSNDPLGTVPGPTTFTATDGGLRTLNATFRTPGPRTLTTSEAGGPQATSDVVAVQASPIGRFDIALQGNTGVTVGSASRFQVTVRRPDGSVFTNYAGTLRITTPGDLTATTTLVSLINGIAQVDVTYRIAGAQTLVVEDTALGVPGTLNVTVAPKTAIALVLQGVPTTAVAPVSLSLVVKAVDEFGNTDINYRGRVSILVPGDLQAVVPSLPEDTTFTAANAGMKTFSLTLRTAGSRTIRVADINDTTLSTSASLTVIAGTAVRLAILVPPPAFGPAPIALGPVQVRLLDPFGNPATDDREVTLSLVNGGVGITLSGTLRVTSQGGIANFTNLSIPAGGLYVLRASAANLASQETAPLPVVLASRILPVLVPSQVFGPTPTRTATEAFLEGLYRLVLGRIADIDGLAYWTGQLDRGAITRAQAVDAFTNSVENRGRQVDNYYRSFLGRGPDANGRKFWVDSLLSGMPEETIVLAFLNSPESQAANDTTFVQRLYQGALGRTADAGGLQFWTRTLAGGTPRAVVANAFVRSAEAAGVAVDSFYISYLRRTADEPMRQMFVDSITSGLQTYAAISRALLSSDEFFANATASISSLVTL